MSLSRPFKASVVKGLGRTLRYTNDDFDLDMSYITDRVVVMSATKNTNEEVAKFFERAHANQYKIYVLCSEIKQDYSVFKTGKINHDFHMEIDKPASFDVIQQFLTDITQFLDKFPRSVVALQCSNGIERCCFLMACYLVYTKKCKSSSEAIKLFSDRRLLGEGLALEEPCQIRYLREFATTIENNTFEKVTKLAPILNLESIRMITIPNFKVLGGCEPWFAIYQRGKRIFFSDPLKGKKGCEVATFDCRNISLSGDIIIDFFHKSLTKKMFSLSFHTSSVKNQVLKFAKRDVDKAWKDVENKHFQPAFRVDLFFFKQAQQRASLPAYTISPHTVKVDEVATHKLCFSCKLIINNEDLSISTSKKDFHWGCASCEKCKKPMSAQSLMLVINDQVTCDSCDVKTFFPKCHKCQQQIVDDTFAEHDDLKFHPDCLKCANCGLFLMGKEFVLLFDEEPHCNNCIGKPEVVIKSRTGSIRGTVSIKKMFLKELLAGQVFPRAAKGELNGSEVTWLLEWSVDDRENVQQAAIKCLSLISYPEERIPGIRKRMFSIEGMFEILIHYAQLGNISLHRDINFQEIEIKEVAGKGASGTVFKGIWRGREVAVKVFDPINNLGFDEAETRRELALTSLLEHENIISCLGGSLNTEKMFIVLEYMQLGSLKEYVESKKVDFLELVKHVQGVARGMAYLQSLQVLHRDLKPDNVMLNKSLGCKLTDFGISRVNATKKGKRLTGNIGTPAYMAPETINPPFIYGEKADVFSYGMMCWELITGMRPFAELKPYEIAPAIVAGKRPEIPENVEMRFAKFIEKMWDNDPDVRPTFEEIDKTLSSILTSSPSLPVTLPPVPKVIPKLTDPSKTQLRFPSSLSLKINEPFPCSFSTFDTENSPRDQGGDLVTASLEMSDGTKGMCHVTDHKNGSYTVNIEATRAGNYQFHVKLKNESIPGSPFGVIVVDPNPPPIPEIKYSKYCFICKQGIAKEYVQVSKGDAHVDCFKCSICKKPISGPVGFTDDGRIFCADDYKNAFSKVCAGCGNHIIDGPMLAALDKHYHPRCFRCCTCQVSLENGEYWERGGKPYCENHAVEMELIPPIEEKQIEEDSLDQLMNKLNNQLKTSTNGLKTSRDEITENGESELGWKPVIPGSPNRNSLGANTLTGAVQTPAASESSPIGKPRRLTVGSNRVKQ